MNQELKPLKGYCENFGWAVEERADNTFTAEVTGEGGQEKTVWIVSTNGVVELSVQSGLVFDEDDDFPGFLSTMMLRLNSKMDYGFWCTEKLSGKKIASIMHNLPPENLDKASFKTMVGKMTASCLELEKSLAELTS